MKQMVCEMCSGTNFLKQDGVYVCQGCGMKYSLEEARRLIQDVKVDVSGSTVKVDNADALQNLYQAARNAMDASDFATALKHYESISAQDPNSWEALFMIVILKTQSITYGEIHSSAIRVSNCLAKVFELIKTTESNKRNQKEAVVIIIEQCYSSADFLTQSSHAYYKELTKGNGSMMLLGGIAGLVVGANSSDKALYEEANRRLHIANIMWNCGYLIETNFDMNDCDYINCALWCWERTLEFANIYHQDHKFNELFNSESMEFVRKKIGELRRKEKQEKEKKERAKAAQEREERKAKYWAEHAEEKVKLEHEKEELSAKLKELEECVAKISSENAPKIRSLREKQNAKLPEEQEADAQKNLIAELEQEYESLGIFKGKEKKAIMERLNKTERPLYDELRQKATAARKKYDAEISAEISRINQEGKELYSEIDKIKKRIVYINTELTKDR